MLLSILLTAPKLRTALKEILTSRRASAKGKELSLEQARQTPETNIVEIDSLQGPVAVQAEVEVMPREKTELWTVKDSVVQFLKTLHPSERVYQVFASEECA